MSEHESKKKFKDLKIIYVDIYEEDNLFAFKNILEDQFQILTFTSPIEAMACIENDKDIAVALLDRGHAQNEGYGTGCGGEKNKTNAT